MKGFNMARLQWSKITSEKRIPNVQKKETAKFRSEIESDYHRIIKSASFRRLQDKTQVFPLDHSDFVRTRLTHSMEVSSLAKLMGKQVCNGIAERHLETFENMPDTIKVMETLNCAGLLHDIGNPPFGHFGEFSIRDWFKKNLDLKKIHGESLRTILDQQQIADLENFEGNAQAIRVITKLHRFVGNHGMHLTSAVMDTIIKYPYSSLAMVDEKIKNPNNRNLLKKKVGYFQSEIQEIKNIKSNTGTLYMRNPLCYLLEAADDLAYTFADLEDGYNKGLYTYDDLYDLIQSIGSEYDCRMLGKELEKSIEENQGENSFEIYKQAISSWLTKKQLYCVSQMSETFLNNYEDIMNGCFNKELINESDEGLLINTLKKFAYDRIYNHVSVLKLELMGNEVLTFLMDRFIDALIYYDTDEEMSEIQKKYIDLLSHNYLDQYHTAVTDIQDEKNRLYHRLLLGTDFISGMSDSYAQRLYRDLRGFY